MYVTYFVTAMHAYRCIYLYIKKGHAAKTDIQNIKIRLNTKHFYFISISTINVSETK